MMRSKLFVPAIRPDMFEKALQSGADAVCFDLEDSVPVDRKSEARQYLQQFLLSHIASDPLILVRTNAVTSGDFLADIKTCVHPAVSAIALPKVESGQEVVTAVQLILETEVSRGIVGVIGVLPTIESPRGLRLAAEIALSSPRVIGLQLGFADLLEPLGISPVNTFARDHIRLSVHMAASEAGLPCYDSAYPDFRDDAGYATQLEAAVSFGLSGSSCIHPAQIAATYRAFTPTASDIAYAQRVVDAADEAATRREAVTQVDGRMIDRPFILRAKQILARAAKDGRSQ